MTTPSIKINRGFKGSLKGYYVYLHTRESDGSVFYVGKGTKDRWCVASTRSLHWRNTARKNGVTCRIAGSSLTESEALALEIKLISEFGRQDLGTGCLVNMTDGGDGVVNYIFTQEHKDKLALASTGRKHTEEHKLYVSKIHKGKVLSEETRKKISIARTGKKMPEAQRLQKLGTPNRASRKVICLETGIVYDCIMNAARDNGLDNSGITKVCNGKRKHYKGYTWKFVE